MLHNSAIGKYRCFNKAKTIDIDIRSGINPIGSFIRSRINTTSNH